jgi:hypothetical protein
MMNLKRIWKEVALAYLRGSLADVSLTYPIASSVTRLQVTIPILRWTFSEMGFPAFGDLALLAYSSDWVDVIILTIFELLRHFYLNTRGSALRTHNPIITFNIEKMQNTDFKNLF